MTNIEPGTAYSWTRLCVSADTIAKNDIWDEEMIY